ncbi:hypothetical protein ACFYOT_16010 [Saccharothrix saharensis]|uniref:hypothetical protein n=1 Tax=Saccharothrix saharensis TaxID=571190 RepID=UPI0036749C4B
MRVLTGPASGTRIERELGRPVELDGDGTYDGDYVQDGNLLVFQRDGETVRMVSLGQLAALAEGEYRADVVLQARGGTMMMTDPDGRPAGR